MGSTYKELKARQRAERDNYPENPSLRVQRNSSVSGFLPPHFRLLKLQPGMGGGQGWMGVSARPREVVLPAPELGWMDGVSARAGPPPPTL